MSRWWRAYDEAVDDPKLQLLPDALFKTWFNLMCLASAHDGVLPDLDAIAFRLRVPVTRASKFVEALRAAKLLDEVEGRLRPHNWAGRQYKSDTDPTNAVRQKRFRSRHRNGENAVTGNQSSVTPITPPRDRVQNTEKKDAANAATPDLLERLPPTPEIDLFRRGKEVLGPNAGGMIANLLKAKDGQIPLARAAIETAATKHNPREYIGAVVRNRDPPGASDHDPRL